MAFRTAHEIGKMHSLHLPMESAHCPQYDSRKFELLRNHIVGTSCNNFVKPTFSFRPIMTSTVVGFASSPFKAERNSFRSVSEEPGPMK